MSIWTTPKPGDGRPVDVLSPIQAATAFSDYPPRSVPNRAVDRPLVTALPVDPQDGDEIRYLAYEPLGLVWHLIYYKQATDSRFPWYFLGGSPLYNETTTADTTTSASYAAPSGGLSTGPALTCPLKGDYEVWIGALMFQTTGGVGYMSYSIGGTGAVDADSISQSSTATGIYGSRYRVKTFTANQTALICVYKTTSNTLNIFDRFIKATPIRVGR